MPAEVIASKRSSVAYVSEGATARQRAFAEGTATQMSWFQALAFEGRVFVAGMGSVTTPLTFLVTAANRPDAWLRVPTGTTIVPIMVQGTLEASAGTATELDLRFCQNDIGNGTSTAATVAPLSYRTDAPITSAITARQLATADTTAETNPISIWRKTYNSAEGTGSEARGIDFIAALVGVAPVLIGPATLELFIAATTTQATGFVQMVWAEWPTGNVT